MSQEQWCIYIDMEGFSALYEHEDQILWSFCEMMRVIYYIGTRIYPSVPDRLFVHQTGDGFVILSDFHELSPVRAIAIAVVLLRYVARTGRFARAAISEGGHADIVGCYPKEVRDSRDSSGVSILGDGLMTLFPVMGTGLIRAVGISKIGPPGPLLLLDPKFLTRLPPEVHPQRTSEAPGAPLAVDWVHIALPLVTDIWSQLGFSAFVDEEIEQKLNDYKSQFNLEKWIGSLSQFLNVKCAGS